MCGFVAVLDPAGDVSALRPALLEQARSLRHRGPDWSGVYADPNAILCHERLAIVDVLHGAQPLTSADGEQVLAVNGEIYNHRQLRAELPDYAFATDSDCEVILPLYREQGHDFLNRLNGMFAFVLWDRAPWRLADCTRSDWHHSAAHRSRCRRAHVCGLGDEGR